MSTVGLKLGSLVIRTISKPIATAIKAQARDHPTFRRICIRLAQSIHRTDMRLRLGLLRDQATIEKIEAAEKAARLAAKEKAAAHAAASEIAATGATNATGTVGTATTAGTSNAVASAEGVVAKPRPVHVEGFAAAPPSSSTSSSSGPTTLFSTRGTTYHIRPLSETKAIDRGAAFISEAFLFAVAGSLILFEALRSRRKETNRQDIISERLDLLEERNRQDAERILWLEEKVWRLEGGKGPVRSIQALPLWEEGEKEVSWLRRIWPQKRVDKAEDEMSSPHVAASSSNPSLPPSTSSSSPASTTPASSSSQVTLGTSKNKTPST